MNEEKMKQSKAKTELQEKLRAKVKANVAVLEGRFLSKSTNSVEWLEDVEEALCNTIAR